MSQNVLRDTQLSATASQANRCQVFVFLLVSPLADPRTGQGVEFDEGPSSSRVELEATFISSFK